MSTRHGIYIVSREYSLRHTLVLCVSLPLWFTALVCDHVRCGLRAMVPGLAPVLGREDNTDEGPRHLWAAECRALGEQMPSEGKVHDFLLLSNGTDVYRSMRTGLKIAVVTPMVTKMRNLGMYDPFATAVAARAEALNEYKALWTGVSRGVLRRGRHVARSWMLCPWTTILRKTTTRLSRRRGRRLLRRRTELKWPVCPVQLSLRARGGPSTAPDLLPWPIDRTEDGEDDEDESEIQPARRG